MGSPCSRTHVQRRYLVSGRDAPWGTAGRAACNPRGERVWPSTSSVASSGPGGGLTPADLQIQSSDYVRTGEYSARDRRPCETSREPRVVDNTSDIGLRCGLRSGSTAQLVAPDPATSTVRGLVMRRTVSSEAEQIVACDTIPRRSGRHAVQPEALSRIPPPSPRTAPSSRNRTRYREAESLLVIRHAELGGRDRAGARSDQGRS
jgi:hypothetical protein